VDFLARLIHPRAEAAPPSAQAASVEPLEARRRQTAGVLLVDVREPDEWRAGHAPGATHIPLGELHAQLTAIPRDRDVLLICRSGNRSQQAQRLLRAAGYLRAINVAGGMIAWGRAGLPIVP